MDYKQPTAVAGNMAEAAGRGPQPLVQQGHAVQQPGPRMIEPQKMIVEVGKLHMHIIEMDDELKRQIGFVNNLTQQLKTVLADNERLKGQLLVKDSLLEKHTAELQRANGAQAGQDGKEENTGSIIGVIPRTGSWLDNDAAIDFAHEVRGTSPIDAKEAQEAYAAREAPLPESA